MLGSLALVVGLALPTIGSGVAGVGVEPAAAADSLSFAPVTAFTVGRDPYSVALGDVNGDGKPDLVTANMSSNSVSVLLGTGTGSFGGRADFEVGSFPYSVALGDVNGDGKPDLVAANVSSNSVSVLLGTGTGSFGGRADFEVGSVPTVVALGDVNGDGKRDLVTANVSSGSVSVLLGTGTGSFGGRADFAVGSSPRYVALGDLNGDGKRDLVTVNAGAGSVSVLLGTGTGSFGGRADFAVGSLPTAVALGDINGDGQPDLASVAVESGSEESSAYVLVNTTDLVPTADAQTVTAQHGVATGFNLTGSDPDGDPITFAVATQPTKGTVSCTSAGACTYTSSPGQGGVDSFTFTVSAGTLTSDPATVTIDIANTAPTATNRTMLAAWGVDAKIGLTGSDADGDPLKFGVITEPTQGTVSCGIDGACTYVANVGSSGTDTFSYRAYDGITRSTAKTVTVTIVDADAARTRASLDGGTGHECAVEADGSVWCWGRDNNGQLGNGTPLSSSPSPVQVTGIATAVSVALTNVSSCALTNDGHVWCWGSDSVGQLGDGGTSTDSPTPVQVTGLSNVKALAGGANHVCALTADGSTWCWGGNASGQLGDGGASASSQVPVQVSGLSGVVAIAARGGHSCAATSTGSVWCWGSDANGELGDGGTSTDSAVPVQVSNLSNVTALAAGSGASCGLTTGGTVWCWGSDSNGQLGNGGSNTDSQVPVQVSGLSGVKGISSRGDTSCAVTAAGTAWCWGSGGGGMLGNGGTADAAVPVQVSGLTDVAGVGIGSSQACAVRQNGVAVCWGTDTYGQLGDGSPLADSSIPVTVAGSHTFRVDEAPEATAQTVSAPRKIATSITLGAFSPTNSALSYSVAIQPSKGSVTCSGSGACTYTSGSGQTGSDSFAFTATDAAGTSDQATVSITLTNTVPVADAQAVSASVHVAKAIALTGSDANGDPLTYAIVANPSKGTLSGFNASTGAVTYTSNLAATGSDSFTFKVNDGTVDSATKTVTINLANTVPVADEQAVSASVHVAKAIALTGSDANGDPLTYAIVANPSKGTLSGFNASTGAVTYTSNLGATGSDTFTFKVNDGTADSATKTVTINLANTLPVPTPQGVSIARRVATGITLAGTDANGDTLTYAVVTQPTKGVLSCTTAGACTYTSNVGQSGTDSFTFKVNDGTSDSASTATVSITLTNTAPTAYAQSVNAPRRVATAITLVGSDVNEDSLTYAILASPSKGTLTGFNAATGAVTYTSNVGATGSDTFTFKVNDGTADSSTATVTVNLTNTLPVPTPQSLNIPRRVGTPIALAGTDANGDTLTYAIVGNPTKGTLTGFNASTGAVTYTSNVGATGTDSFTFKVNDGTADSASTATVSITLANTAPVADAQTVSAAKHVAKAIALTGSDANSDTLTYAIVGSPAKGTLTGFNASTGAVTYTSNVGATGSDTFTFKVNDGTADSSTATVTVNLTNTLPVPTPQSLNIPRRVATGITLAGTDANADTLTYAIVGNPTKGTLTGFNASTGAVTYTSNVGATGTDSFTFKVNDGTADSASTATVSITLTNTAPVADAQAVSAAKHVAKAITLTGSDANADALSYAIVGNPTKGTLTGFNASTGAVTYTSVVGATGSDSFTFRVNDGTVDSVTATVTVNLTNTAPVAQGLALSAVKHVEEQFQLSGTDANGDGLTFAAGSAGKGTVSCDPSGWCSYTSDVGATGTDSFTFRVNDGIVDSATATVTIDLTNTVPVADAQSVSAVKHQATAISLSGSDVNADPVTYAIVAGPAKGSLTGLDASTGAVTYTSDVGATGTDSFTFKVNDGTADSAVATVTVDLTNTAPVADDQDVAASAHVATHVVLSGSDANADPVTYAIVDDPAKGTLSGFDASTGSVTYTSDTGATGSDTFTFRVHDGTVGSAPATVTVHLGNDAPVATAQAVTVPRRVAVGITLAGTDANDDPLGFRVVDGPTKGSLECGTGDLCTYTSSPGESGTDSFTFVADDGMVESAPATVTITLGNSAPTAYDQPVSADRHIAKAIQLVGSDVNEDALTYAIVGNPSKGTLSGFDSATGAVTYTSDLGATGPDSFTFRVDDGTTSSATATVSLELVNSVPVVQDRSVDAPRWRATDVALGGADVNGDSLTFTVVDQPAHGTVSCEPSGACAYTSDDATSSTDSFTYRASDGIGQSAPATVEVAIGAGAAGPQRFGPPVDRATENTPIAVAAGELDGDGVADLAVANYGAGTISIYLGSGTGTFGPAASVPTGGNPHGVTVADVNADGNQDLLAANATGDAVTVLLGTGSGSFGAPVHYPTGWYPEAVATGDFDHDGNVDLAVANYSGATVSVLLGAGDGTFGSAVNHSVAKPDSVSVGDLDEDGNQDLVLASVHANVASVLLGDGHGGFGPVSTFGTGASPFSTQLADLDGDHHLDLVVADYDGGTISALLGDGAGSFGPKRDYPVGFRPISVAVGDYDGDAVPDVAVANAGSNSVSVLLGTGSGAFGAKADRTVGVLPYSIVARNLDGDARPDLAVVNRESGTVSVLLNTTNRFPSAAGQEVDAARQVATTFDLAGSDPDGDHVTYEVATPPTKGSVECDASGTCTYTSAAGQTGTDSFTYKVNDGLVGSPAGTVTINLTNSAPVAEAASYRVTKGIARSFDLAAEDPNGDALTYEVTSQPSLGTLSCDAAGACTYTATGADVGSDSFGFVARDSEGAVSASATVSIEIAPPRVSIGDAQILEPDVGRNANGVFMTLNLSSPMPTDVVVRYHTVNGTAVGAAKTLTGDYTVFGTPTAPKGIVIPAGQSWAAIAPPVNPDSVEEGDETFSVVLDSVTAANGAPVTIGDDTGTVTIVDNYRAGGDPILFVGDVVRAEGDAASGSKAQVTVTLSKPVTQDTTFGILWANGTALEGIQGSGKDWKRGSLKTYTIPAGKAGFTIDFTIWGDTKVEPDETMTVAIVPPDGAPVIQAKAQSTTYIVNDD